MDADKVRVDKWLWSVRWFKSRTLAATACKNKKVKINDIAAKPSSMVMVGDLVEVKKNGFTFTLKVVKLLSKRVSAVLAQPCYENLTTPEELNKFNKWFTNHPAFLRERGTGRPTKRERRDLDKLKKEDFDPDWEFLEEE